MEWLEIILIFLAALAGGLIGGYAGSGKTYRRILQDREAQQHPSKEEYAVATQPAYYRPAPPPAHNGIPAGYADDYRPAALADIRSDWLFGPKKRPPKAAEDGDM